MNSNRLSMRGIVIFFKEVFDKTTEGLTSSLIILKATMSTM